jgi:beta-lactamase regulating signal transducer with metallopeptidase domain
MNWLHYLVEGNIYLSVFYLCYCLFLNRETHYTLNRAYLLTACVLAFVLPLTQVSIIKPDLPVINQVNFTPVITTAAHTGKVAANTPTPEFTLHDALLYAYIWGAFVALIIFTFRLYRLFKLSNRSKEVVDNKYKVVYLDDNDNTAFSFFNYLFISTNVSRSATIITHELVHIRQKHSVDIMLLEVLKVVNWFNPFIYFTQRSLKAVHEYIADEQTAAHEHDAITYSSFLLNNAYGIQGSSIAHSFFNYNLLKKRIIMLNKNRSGRLARLKYLAVLPLCGGMLCASTLVFSKDYAIVDLAPKQLTVKADTTIPAKPTIPSAAAQLPPPPPPPPFESVYSDLMTYAAKHIRYPARAFNNNITGNVLLSLRLDNAHKISDVKIEKGIGSGCDEEAVRALKSYTGSIEKAPGNYHLIVSFMLFDNKNKPVNAVKPVSDAVMNRSNSIGQVEIRSLILQIPPPPPPAPAQRLKGSQAQPKVKVVRFAPPAVKADQPAKPIPAPKVEVVRFPPPKAKAPKSTKPIPAPKIEVIHFPPAKAAPKEPKVDVIHSMPPPEPAPKAPTNEDENLKASAFRDPAKAPIIFVNGQRYHLKEKVPANKELQISATDSVTVYTSNDKAAIAKWGNEAKNGVIDLYGKATFKIK